MDLPTQIQERLDALGVLAADVEERFVRGSGPGGQKINKTSSTVCLRHGPTGVEVRCQKERSQAANRVTAWEELCAKLEGKLRAAELVRQEAIPRGVVTINLAGEPLTAVLADRLYASAAVERVYDLYGPSEDTTYSTCALRVRGETATIGRVIANSRLYLVDADFQPVPAGAVGTRAAGV